MQITPRIALPQRTVRVGKIRRYRNNTASRMVVDERAYKIKHADTVYAINGKVFQYQ